MTLTTMSHGSMLKISVKTTVEKPMQGMRINPLFLRRVVWMRTKIHAVLSKVLAK